MMAFLDRNANNPKRLLRNAQRLRAPANLTASISLSTTGGIQFTSGKLSIKIDAAGTGLSLSSSGLKYTNPLTTKGDLATYSTAPARLAVGANNTIVTADSAQTTGIKWTSAPLLASTQVGDNASGNYVITLTETDSTLSNRVRAYTKFYGGNSRKGHIGYNVSLGDLELMDDAGNGMHMQSGVMVFSPFESAELFTIDYVGNSTRVNSSSDDGSFAPFQVVGPVSITSGVLKIGLTQILTTQQAAVADAVAGTVVAQFNSLLAKLRTHGIIAT
jgi:hypothetical protein